MQWNTHHYFDLKSLRHWFHINVACLCQRPADPVLVIQSMGIEKYKSVHRFDLNRKGQNCIFGKRESMGTRQKWSTIWDIDIRHTKNKVKILYPAYGTVIERRSLSQVIIGSRSDLSPIQGRANTNIGSLSGGPLRKTFLEIWFKKNDNFRLRCIWKYLQDVGHFVQTSLNNYEMNMAFRLWFHFHRRWLI